MPTYITQADIEEHLGEDSLVLIADPTFSDDEVDVDIVEKSIDWAEGEVLARCRGIPASGAGTWESQPAQIVKPAKELMVTLAIYGIHERVRAAQGIAIPKGVIDSKADVYKTLEALKEGDISWVASEIPARQVTQSVTVYLDSTGRGRQTLGGQIRKLVR